MRRTRSVRRSPWVGGDLDADVVVAQSLPLGTCRRLRRSGARLVFDLYAPALVEAAAHLAEDRKDGDRTRRPLRGSRRDDPGRSSRLGDAFLCASDRQRDHWLGALAALGRVSPETLRARPVSRARSSPSSRSGSTRATPVGGRR